MTVPWKPRNASPATPTAVPPNYMTAPAESIELGLLGVVVLLICFVAAMLQWSMAVVQSILFYC